MNNLYRKVLTSERMPKESGRYHTNSHIMKFIVETKQWKDNGDYTRFPDYWFEPVQLPSEDEIETMIDNLLIERGEHPSRVRGCLYGEERETAKKLAIQLITETK